MDNNRPMLPNDDRDGAAQPVVSLELSSIK